LLPNLLIIGASKCGTTSLHSYLDAHPEVMMARPRESWETKEMRYFWRSDWRERLEWYEGHFDVPTAVRGEATPAYSWWPLMPDVPSRVHSLVPDVKLIYLVRDPVERIRSHWVQKRADGDPRSFTEAMREPERPDHPLVCPSRYATQVEQYMRVFSPSQLLVLDQRELLGDRRRVLREAFTFIGVDADFYSPAFDAKENARSDKYRLTAVGHPVWHRFLKRGIGRLPSRARRPVGDPVKRLLSRRIDESPTIGPELRARLSDLLGGEVARLREFTGRDFASWSL